MLIFACILAVAVAAPATYDQRQDGDFNVRADVQNVVFLVAVPSKMTIPVDFLGLIKSAKRNQESELQDRADVQVMEAFVEPSEPYHVEIGDSRNAGGDGRAVEVVIAGRRRLETEPQTDDDEYKLIGATEQCGPDRERDPVTLACRARSVSEPPADPEKDKEPQKPAAEVPASPAEPAPVSS